MTRNRDITWDYARGIAIVMIVLHHIYARFYECSNGRIDSVVYWCCYAMQLPIFMYISGMFSRGAIAKYSVLQLLKNRAIRLLIPFFSFIFIWLFIHPNKIYSVWLEDFKDGYWFTFVLFEMVVILSFAYLIAQKISARMWLMTSVFYILLTLYKIVFPTNNVISHLLSINLVWHYFPFFVMGYYSNAIGKLLKMKYAFLYFVVFVVSLYFFIHGSKFVLPLCNCFGLLLVLSIIQNGVRPAEKFIALCGYYSLQVYLLHYFVRLFVCEIPLFNNQWVEFLCNVLIALAVIVVAIGVSLILMKNKWLRLFLFGVK